MMRRWSNIARMGKNEDGSTLLEFAFVMPVFVMMLLGGLDVGYSLYLRTVGSGTLESAARSASLQGATEAELDTKVREAMSELLPRDERTNPDALTIVKKSYSDYSRVDQPEILTLDDDGDGVLDIGDCWADEDENGEFGLNQGRAGLGGSDDAVFYTVNLAIPRLFPMHTLVGWSETQRVSVTTVIINQPYGAQPIPPTVCRET